MFHEVSPEVALRLHKPTIQPCMKYCGHVWAGGRVYMTVGLSLLTSVEPLAHSRHVVSWSLFLYRHYRGICLSKLVELVLLPYSSGRSTLYSDRLHDFSVTIPRCFKNVMSTVSFLTQLDSGILCLWNPFLWPMIYDALSLELPDILYL